MAYIDFALEEPNLFRMLFMSYGFSGRKLTEFFEGEFEGCTDQLYDTIAEVYDTEAPESNRMFIDIWLYAHGIASMLVTNQLPTPRSEIESMVENMYSLLLKQGKRRKE